MHRSAFNHMKIAADEYFDPITHRDVVEVGAILTPGVTLNHRQIFKVGDVKYTGVDLSAGENVDIVMEKPYRLPLSSNSADVIVCGQVFEHVPFVWVTMLEMARVLRVGGLIFASAPSRGHVHLHPYDCWRFYPDGMRSLGAFAGLETKYAHTDFPPRKDGSHNFDYGGITPDRYWGDTVAVFEKTAQYNSLMMALLREPLVAWANSIIVRR